MSQLTERERRPSADTVVDENTGERTEPTPTPSAPEKPKMDITEAKSKTERLLKFRDFLQSRLLAWAAGDLSQHEDFGMEKWEFEMLADVYNDVVLSMGYIPKWFDILIAETMVIAPKIVKLFNVRKLTKENEQQKARIRQLEQAVNSPYRAPVEESNFRVDAKKWWEVDAQGYFIFDKGGYITKENKKDKPNVTDPAQYAMAVKYNGVDKIHRIFNINTGA